MADDRDTHHKKTPPAVVKAQLAGPVEFIEEELTGRCEGEELAKKRANRPTGQRVAHLETRVDGVVETIAEWRVEVSTEIGKVVAAVGSLAGEVKGLATVVGDSRQREHVTFTAKVDVDKNNQLSDIDVAAKRETAEIETDKAARIARIEVYKTLALRIIAGAAVIGSLLAAGAKLNQCGG